MRNFESVSLENVENQTNSGVVSDNLRKNYVVQSCGKHQREERVALGVRSMVGKVSLENLEKIMSWLNDDKIDKIGVFGMGGCGKTTLAIHVYNRLLQSELPYVLVWVTVGMGFDVHKLQLCISSAVGLDLDQEKDETRRAAMLHNFLAKKVKYVLFLDNLWDHFSFEKVGIPFSGACKVIITTRMLSVCGRIGCKKTIKIGMLGSCEAWELFCSVLGHGSCEALTSDDIGHVARLICQECAGLPISIVHLARSLRGVNSVSEWKLTLHRLRGIPKEHELLMTTDLFLKLHWSYAKLTNATIKLSLLYCTLYPKNCKIPREELIRLWISVGLIEEVSSLQAQYDKGHTIINKLVDCSLLDSSEANHFVKMHDVIRNMAIRITRQNIRPQFLVKCGAQFKDLAEALAFKEDFHAVSLARNDITDIPLGTFPKYPKLSVLLLQHIPLKNVPASFFLNMPSLFVLDLSSTSIQSLPDSISDLQSLKSLLLRCCQKLTYVPSLANLNALRILDLGYSAIKRIPYGIEKLTMLRELDLSGFHKLKELNYGLISRLPALKRISCYVMGILQQLNNLRSLEILDATFHNISDYNCYVKSEHWRLLDSFHLQVGDVVEQEKKTYKEVWHYSNIVAFYGCSLAAEREQLVLPENLNQLHINNCEGLGSLCDMLNWDSSSYKNVHAGNSQGYDTECKKLYRENSKLHNSKYHLDGDVKSGGLLPNLEICTISRCHDIEKLFTPTQIMGLESLEILEIRDCSELKELISDKDCNSLNRTPSECSPHTFKLPNLRRLELTKLPMLSSIYRGLLLCTSLQSILVDDCPKLTRLPFSFFLDDQHKVLLPMLQQIEGPDEWWDSLQLNQSDTKLSLQTLFRSKNSTRGSSESGCDQSR
uniref:NB-ARC domain-containing protein n=2 Tax=Chenopodium quinoa TaxID=63459 RepID=A0A803M9Q7_CHEQI